MPHLPEVDLRPVEAEASHGDPLRGQVQVRHLRQWIHVQGRPRGPHEDAHRGEAGQVSVVSERLREFRISVQKMLLTVTLVTVT